jgi:hypothetical protein
VLYQAELRAVIAETETLYNKMRFQTNVFCCSNKKITPHHLKVWGG